MVSLVSVLVVITAAIATEPLVPTVGIFLSRVYSGGIGNPDSGRPTGRTKAFAARSRPGPRPAPAWPGFPAASGDG
jgi:hypothetical protein